ncbi:MAG: hypothetical protein WA213_20820 [Terriglobales bacterium]
MIILPGAKREDWAYENGREVVWFDENPVTKHVILTSPMSPKRHGYNRAKTSVPAEMDRIFTRLAQQEYEANQRLIERIYYRGREYYERVRSNLLTRLMSADTKEWEKAFIRESLRLMDERDSAMQRNTVYGVSGMQSTEAPIEGTRQKVMVN